MYFPCLMASLRKYIDIPFYNYQSPGSLPCLLSAIGGSWWPAGGGMQFPTLFHVIKMTARCSLILTAICVSQAALSQRDDSGSTLKWTYKVRVRLSDTAANRQKKRQFRLSVRPLKTDFTWKAYFICMKLKRINLCILQQYMRCYCKLK